AITHYDKRGVQATDVSGVVMYRWHAASTHLIYPMDYDGDENWDIHVVDIATGEDRNVTATPTVRDEIVAYDDRHPNEAVLQVGERHPLTPDLYRIDLMTGARTRLTDAGNYIGYLADNDLAPRLAVKINAAGGVDVDRRRGDAWQAFMSIA